MTDGEPIPNHGDRHSELGVNPRQGFERAAELARRLQEEIRKVFIGQDQVIDEVLTAFFAAGHVLIEGVPGLGKTLLVLSLARTFNASFSRVQFTPDLMPSDITGHAMFDMQAGSFRIRRGPAFTHLLLADEINRAPAKTQAALLEVMQEQQITIEGERIAVPQPFMTLATQNPVEQEGTYPLPEAQLDRFLLKIRIDYPTEEEENLLVRHVTQGRVGDSLDVSAVNAVASAEDLLALRETVSNILVEERVSDYAVRLVRASRSWPGLTLGASPRGAIALVRVGRAKALLAGRDFVLPDDVKSMTGPALRHRVLVAPELEIEGHHADEVLGTLVESVEAPRT